MRYWIVFAALLASSPAFAGLKETARAANHEWRVCMARPLNDSVGKIACEKWHALGKSMIDSGRCHIDRQSVWHCP